MKQNLILIFQCVDEGDEADDSNSLNGGFGKSSSSPYDDDDIGKILINVLFFNYMD